MIHFTVTTAPASEPITASEAKMHLRVSHDTEDDLIERLITAAREWCEAYQNRCYITQTLTAYSTGFAKWTLTLPRRPVQSVTSIVYVDTDGNSQTMDAEDYRVDLVSGTLEPIYGTTWPVALPVSQSVAIEYVAGYGDASDVPSRVKQAMLLLIGHWYENRELEVIGTTTSPLKFAIDSLLSLDRDKWI